MEAKLCFQEIRGSVICLRKLMRLFLKCWKISPFSFRISMKENDSDNKDYCHRTKHVLRLGAICFMLMWVLGTLLSFNGDISYGDDYSENAKDDDATPRLEHDDDDENDKGEDTQYDEDDDNDYNDDNDENVRERNGGMSGTKEER